MAPGVAALFHYNLSPDKDPEVQKKALKCINDVLQVRTHRMYATIERPSL